MAPRTGLRCFALLLASVASSRAEDVVLAGLDKPVEILRDRWGIPHIYAETVNDLFFAQGYMAARDRLFQIDLWRRIGAGRLAEVLGPSAVARDRIARLVRYRGDWQAEWSAYGPDAREIAVAFTRGINAYIDSLRGRRPLEFRLAGYDPGRWEPEDVVARVAGLLMTRNITREVQRAQDITTFGLAAVEKYLPPDPPVKIQIPAGLDLRGITSALLADYNAAVGSVRFPAEQGSNNWVVSGARSATGKPLLANDPHRPLQVPSLRKTVHLVGPGWNVIGAGEPSLPGVALGHNENIAFGFTIVGIDQADLYVERLDPANPDRYLYRGKWTPMRIVEETIAVKGERSARRLRLRFTVHGPVIAEDLGRHRALALKWVGSEPGSAGYFAALRLARSRNWEEFQQAAAFYKVPSENLVYADRDGNIGWIAAGLAPIRKNWTGLLPVPGHEGRYEWAGFLPAHENPRSFNPPSGFIATANHNILPPGYRHALGYEWAPPFRYQRIVELLAEKQQFTLADFERIQQDVVSHPARLFQNIVRGWKPAPSALTRLESHAVRRLLAWDARMNADSPEALLFSLWVAKLHTALLGPKIGPRTEQGIILRLLARSPNPAALQAGLRAAIADLEKMYGSDFNNWKWGRLHHLTFNHPLGRPEFRIGPLPRPGDGNTVNAASGTGFRQTNGASYRQIIDLSDWDASVMTNVPGESGDPSSPHYKDLVDSWAAGRYHPMLYSRPAIEAAAIERIVLRSSP